MTGDIALARDLAHRQWFKVSTDGQPDDIDDLLAATGIPLANGVDRLQFGYRLNDLIQQAVSQQIRGLRSKTDAVRIMELSAYVVEYIELAERLNQDGDVLPIIPSDRQEYFYALRDGSKDADKARIRKNTAGWQRDFYPRCLGFYAAAFGRVPRSTYNEDTGRSDNPTVLFIEYILEHVGDEQLRLGFDERFGIEHGTNCLCWSIRANNATIRARIAEGLKEKYCPPELPDGQCLPIFHHTPAGTLLWELSRDFFLPQLVSEQSPDTDHGM